jgi:transcriptional regulator with PAS, ATPase and Fis domain
MSFPWPDEFPGSITVCDPDGIIVYMNARSALTFAAEGGAALLGSSLLDCHPAPARLKLKELLVTRQKNIYSIEKNGLKKLIYQSPWYENGEYRGFVEMALEIPFDMPHFIRS